MKKIEKEREKKRKKTILDENKSTSTLSQDKSKESHYKKRNQTKPKTQ
jgi:hypothetical protein